MFENGLTTDYTVDADTLFLLVNVMQGTSYSVSVAAINGAGIGPARMPEVSRKE